MQYPEESADLLFVIAVGSLLAKFWPKKQKGAFITWTLRERRILTKRQKQENLHHENERLQ